MGRPRKDAPGLGAQERLREAFWEALDDRPFAQMTVSDVVSRAQVNRNAFYYHYPNLHALAEECIATMLPVDIACLLTRVSSITPALLDQLAGAPGRKESMRRLRCAIGPHGSGVLNDCVKRLAYGVWLDMFSLASGDLTRGEEATVRFAIAGFMELLGGVMAFSPSDAAQFFRTAYGSRIIGCAAQALTTAQVRTHPECLDHSVREAPNT